MSHEDSLFCWILGLIAVVLACVWIAWPRSRVPCERINVFLGEAYGVPWNCTVDLTKLPKPEAE